MLTKAKKNFKNILLKLRHNFEEFRTNHPIVYTAIVFLIAIFVSFILEKCLRKYYNHFLNARLGFSIVRLILVGVATEIFFLALAHGKKGMDFVYKYRYIFGAGLFMLCVVMRINYSSVGVLDGLIQPNHPTQSGDIITGVNRAIRSDEYVVNTPMVISQYHNDFDLVNPDSMADNVITSLFPKAPNKTLLSLLTSPQFLGFVFLPFDNAFSFYQLLPWFVAFFAVFEMLMIMTKQRKLMSFIGASVVIFSPVVLWFDSVQYIMYVALLFDIFYLFIHHGKSWRSKLGISVLFGWVAACFTMIVYPAWQVPYGYVLLVLLICLIVNNRKALKGRDLLYVLPVIGVIIMLVVPNILISLDQYKLVTQTVYPGQRSESGGGGLAGMFYTIPSTFFPISEMTNSSEASGFICLFPIPILLGVYTIHQSFKKKQYDSLLIGLVVLSVFFSFMCFIGNGLIAKITLLSLTPPMRLRPVLELTCLLIIIRLIATHQTTARIPKKPTLLALAVSVITAILVYLGNAQLSMRPAMICTAFVVYYALIYCLIDNRKNTSYIIGAIALLFAGYQVLTVHPLRTGLAVYTDKPVAQKIRDLSSQDQSALWLTSSSMLSQYALANDARVINSVNYYPTIDRWEKFDPDGSDNDVYNRFAHVSITIKGQGETSFESLYPDAFNLDLNYNDICLLEPTYFLSNIDYNYIPGWSKKLIYKEDGIYIYQFDCQK